MFDSRDAAREALEAAFEPPFVDAAMRALVPAIGLLPTGAGAALGGTRIGGAPDLAQNSAAALAWPRPEPPDDPEAIARLGNNAAAASMRAHFARNPPFAFLAQIDLAEAAALGSSIGPLAGDLPGEGRLLLFYDLAVGPWDSGARVGRVIWDRAPREALRPAALPADLAEADEAFRREAVAAFEASGLPPPAPGTGTIYAAPGRAAALRPSLQLPAPWSLDMAALPDIPAAAPQAIDDPGNELDAAYCDFFDEHGREAPANRHLLLGLPVPEQDDPRCDAAALCEAAPAPGEDDAARDGRIEAAARDWRLLFQLDIADWSQDNLAEGTVYFLIRSADLAARRFEATVAVYQQT